MDTDEGNRLEPSSLHKYLYASANPINRIDPSGHDDMADITMSMAIDSTLNSILPVPNQNTPAGPAYTSLAALFTPASVWSTLESATPDAVEVGVSFSGALGGANRLLPAVTSASGGFGFEELFSTRGSDAATYLSSSLMFGGGNPYGLGVGVTFGLVYNCPIASQYSGPFLAASIPVGRLPKSVAALAPMAASAAYAHMSGSPATAAAIMYALGALSALDSTATATVFSGFTGSPALGVLFGSPSGGGQLGLTADILLSKDVPF
jgi:hypothetical protein